MMDAVQPIPLPFDAGLLGNAFSHGNQNYWKSRLLKTLPEDAIKTAIEHANRLTSPKSAVVMEYYGSAASRVPNDATAFAQREFPWDIVLLACWTGPEERQHRCGHVQAKKCYALMQQRPPAGRA